MTGTEPLFSIIIPNFNKAGLLPEVLKSVFQGQPATDFEVLLMDDCSIDCSVDVASQFPVRLEKSAARVGPAALRNRAARLARGKYLLFMDSDVVLFPETLPNFKYLCRQDTLALVTGVESLPCVGDNWIGTFRTLQLRELLGGEPIRGGSIGAWGSTFGAIRRDIFLQSGGFNEKFKGPDIEDHELCLRLSGKNEMILAPELKYRHTYPSASELLVKQFKRATQMIQLDRKAVMANHSFYQMRFKAGHILALGIWLSLFFSFYSWIGSSILLPLLVLNGFLHSYILKEGLRLKGPLFCVYAFCINLVMTAFVTMGVLVGFLKRWKR